MIYFRVDMNNIIATGHVMRCLSIASAAKSKGIECTFFLSDSQAKELIESKGFQTIVLNSQWNNLEGELPNLKRYIKELNVKNLIVDTYQVTFKYLECLSAITRTFYIDDMNKFIYPVYGIICYANYWKKFNYQFCYENAVREKKISFVPKFFEGCSYVPLREEFQMLPDKIISEKIDNVLILSGGTDNLNIFESILGALDLGKYEEVNVVCGKYYNHYYDLKKKFSKYPQVYIHKQINNLIHYMQKADLAISAGGTTLYELCAVGTPTISYSFVDNQLDNVNQFALDGVITYAGDLRCDGVYENIHNIIEKDYFKQEIRKQLSQKMRVFVDGFGATRIVEQILKNK